MAYGGKITYDIGFNIDKNGLAGLKTQLDKLRESIPSSSQLMKMDSSLDSSKAMKQMHDIRKSIDEVEKAFRGAFNADTGLMNLQKLNNSLNTINVNRLAKNFSYMGKEGKQAFYEVTKSALTTEMQFKKTNGLLDRMGKTFANTIKWQVSSSIIHKFTGSIQEAYGYVKHLDSSLNDIRIVTGKSADEMDRFAKNANKAAKSLGAATTDYTEASLIYYQQGLGDDEVRARTETTLKAANVTGQSTAEVSEQLTAVWNGFKITAEGTEAAVDKLAAVAATTASNLQELSTGMSKVASAANSMGIDIDQLNAQLSTIISVTRQAPESVGTALKTIYARIGDLKLGDADEDGLKLGDVAEGLDKLGINVLDAQGDLRDLGKVIEEVAGKWSTWTSAQQAAVAELMAGKRQYNNLIALFDNWGMYESALATSKNAVGTLQKQQDVYMESTEAHLQQLSTQWEDFYDSILDANIINSLADILTKVINLFTQFIDSIGGGKSLLVTLGATAIRVFDKQIAGGITRFITNIKTGKDNLSQLNAQLNNIAIFNQFRGMNAAMDSLLGALNTISQYYDYMNNEQINMANSLAKQIGDTEILKENWEDDAKAVRDYASGFSELNKTFGYGGKKSNLKGSNLDKIAANFNEDYTKDSKLESSMLAAMKKSEESIKHVIENENKVKDSFNNIIKTVTKGIDDIGDRAKKVSTQIKNLPEQEEVLKNLDKIKEKAYQISGSIDNLNKTGLLKDVDPKQIQAIQASIEKINKLSSKNTTGDIKRAVADLDLNIQGLPQSAKMALDKIRNTFKEGATPVTKFTETIKELKQRLKELGETAKLQKITESITGAVGALGQLASSMSTLSNLPSIWSNKDLSDSEKMLQTITNIGFALPMLVSSYGKFTACVKKATIAITENSLATKILNKIEKGEISAKELFNKLSKKEQKDMLKRYGYKKADKALTDEQVKSELALNEAREKGAAIASKALGVTIAAVIAWKAIKFAYKEITDVEKERLKRNYEEAKLTYENNQKKLQALQEEKEKIEELSKSYNEIYNARDEQNELTKEQQDRIYELVKAYGNEDLIVLALKKDYDALANSIKNANNEKNKELFEQSEATIASGKNMLAAKVKQKDFGVTDILSTLSDEQKESFIKKSEELKDFQLAYADILMSMSEEELSQYFLDNADTSLGKAMQKYYESNTDAFAKIRESNKTRKTAGLNLIGGQFDTLNIKNYKDFSTAVSSLANEALTKGFVDTEEEGRTWARDFLAGVESNFQEFANKDVFKTSLEEGLKFSSEEIENFFENNSQSAINFLSDNMSLANSFKSLDAFKEAYKDLFDRLADQDYVFKIKTALVNSEGKEFKQEDIDAIFADKDIKLKVSVDTEKDIEKEEIITQEDFENKSFAEQQGALLAYYLQAGQLENEFQQKQREGIEKENEARKIAIEEQKEKYEKIFEDIEGNADIYTDQSYFKTIFQNKELTDEDLDHIEELAQQYTEALSKSVEEQDNFVFNLSDEDLKYVKYFDNLSNEQFESVKKNLKANKQYREELKKLGLEYKTAAEITQDFITANEEINSISDMLEEVGMSWKEYGEQVQNALSATNTGIDNLQSAYSSLNSVIEEYNETGKLSIDNLQTFLNMDTAYLSALQIENGQMTLNEEALKQIALARLDEAEAEAYEQAMTELNDEARRREIEGVETAAQSLVMLGNTAVSAGEAARSGAQGWREYWAAALNNEGIANDAYAEKVGQALYVKLQAIDAVRQQILSGDLGGALGGSSSSSSGSEKEAEHEEYLERETDLYAEINQELDDIENHLKRIQETESHSWGQSQLDAIQEENKLLDEQLDKLREKKKIQEGDLSVRRKQLEDLGATFSEDGAILYGGEDLINSLYANYNGMVDTFNAMSADEQEAYKVTLEAEKDRIDKIEKATDDYIKLYSDYQSVIDEIQKAYYDKIAKDVEEFNFRINLKLELDDVKREWSDFWHDIINDLDSDDFAGQINKLLDNVSPLLGGNGEISDLTNHINEVVSAVATQISSHGLSGMFGVDTALSKEQLEEYMNTLKTKLQDVKEALDGVAENYLKQLDKANELIEEQVKGWESVGDHIEHNIELIKMISGDDAYDELGKQFDQQYENDLKLLQTQKMSKDYWAEQIKKYQDLLEITEEGSKEWKTYSEALTKSTEEYRQATADLDSTLKETLEDIKSWYENSINKVTDALDKSLSGNLGLDLMEKEWKLIDDAASDYYDNVERWYNMEDYTKQLNDAANAIGLSAQNQAKLVEFRDKELEQLNAKEKLTQYDIEESKARLEILKAQLALEDLQQNKSKMRLRRDNQGNYTYQYTGDEAAIDQAENGLLTARRNWYEIVKKRYQETSNKIIEISKEQVELQKQIADAKAAGDTERENKLMEMYKRNQDRITFWYEQAGENQKDLKEGVAQYFAEVDNAEILPQSEATVRTLIDQWAGSGENSFTGAVSKAIDDTAAVVEEFNRRNHVALVTAGVDYQNLVQNGIDPTTDALNDLVDSNDELGEKLEENNELLREQEEILRDLEDAYNQLESAASEALQSSIDMLEQLSRASMDAINDINAAVAAAPNAPTITETSSYTPNDSGGGTPTTTNDPLKNLLDSQARRETGITGPGDSVQINLSTGQIIASSSNANPQDVQRRIDNALSKSYTSPTSGELQGIKEDNGHFYVIGQLGINTFKTFLRKDKRFTYIGEGTQGFIRNRPVTLKTGGYTGEWGDTGRLAVLHQKELVLNESDTANILKAVSLLREIPIDSFINSILGVTASISGLLSRVGTDLQQQASSVSAQTENNYRNMTVNADFSGVRSAEAIYQALTELENQYSQTAYSTSPIANRRY